MCGEEVSMSGRPEMERYLESCQTEFWQGASKTTGKR
jgi:hypothetical protein